jgi:hypothetical protein
MWNGLRRVSFLLLTCSLHTMSAEAGRQAHRNEVFGRVPLHFDANMGQSQSQVKFLAHGSGYTVFLTSSDAVLRLPGAAFRMALLGANDAARATGRQELPGKANYFIGSDSARWRTNVPTYARVQYDGVYPGIDLSYYGNQHQLEYDFIVNPGADPTAIALRFQGAERLELEPSGDLIVHTGAGAVRQRAPTIFQREERGRRRVAGGYVLRRNQEVGFHIAAYDRRRALVIDPALVYSTFLGGSGDDSGLSIALDHGRRIYVTGSTNSADFPTTVGAFDPTANGGNDVFVSKMNRAGTELAYSTYLGGSGEDGGRVGITVDSAGRAYVTGSTSSTDFPTTAGAFQTTLAGPSHDAFVAKLDRSGSALQYSTYLGGSGDDMGQNIAVDDDGRAYVTGDAGADDFPTTPGAFDTTFNGGPFDAFVTKLNRTGTALVYSTFVGGSATDRARDITLDGAGRAHITGFTSSLDFPTTSQAFDTTYNGGAFDAFVTKLNPSGSSLAYSSYIGGAGTDQAIGIDIDRDGGAHAIGQTDSADFPVTPDGLDTTFNGSQDVFVVKLNRAGSALGYSTYLGGAGSDQGSGIAVGRTGRAHIVGLTNSTDFPTTADAFSSASSGNFDAFVSLLNPSGSTLDYSTYLGGTAFEAGTDIAVDRHGDTYVTGVTRSADFPTTPQAFDATLNGGSDAFVVKISASDGNDNDHDDDDDADDDDDGGHDPPGGTP